MVSGKGSSNSLQFGMMRHLLTTWESADHADDSTTDGFDAVISPMSRES
jgi:hypothetical protein